MEANSCVLLPPSKLLVGSKRDHMVLDASLRARLQVGHRSEPKENKAISVLERGNNCVMKRLTVRLKCCLDCCTAYSRLVEPITHYILRASQVQEVEEVTSLGVA